MKWTMAGFICTALALVITSVLGFTSLNKQGDILKDTGATLSEVRTTLKDQGDILKDTGATLSDIRTTLNHQGDTLKRTVDVLDRIETALSDQRVMLGDTGAALTNLTQRLERMDIIDHIIGKLSSTWWHDYVSDAQKAGSGSTPRYMTLSPGGAYELTDEGKNLLPLRFTQAIVETLRKDKNIPQNEIILRLDIRELSVVAFAEKIPPKVMIGTIATFIERTRVALP